MTWFFLLITALALFDAVVFVLVVVWGLRERKGQQLTKERFRQLLILVIINLVIVLASKLLVWIPDWRNWLLPRIEGDQSSWTLIPTIWLFDHRMLWYQICKILGLIGLWVMRKQQND